jgi:GntR family transcriptional regulator
VIFPVPSLVVTKHNPVEVVVDAARSATLPPSAHAPRYARLRQAIRARIAAGEWRAGDQIPTIRQLGEAYGVSHITVVQALEMLAREGWIVRRQGKGVFVGQPRADEPRLALRDFGEGDGDPEKTPVSRTLRLRRQPATADLVARLCLKVDEEVVLLERLHSLDGSPLGVQKAYFPEHFVPGLVERSEPIESVYGLLADAYSLVPTSAAEIYLPTTLGRHQARLLEARPGTPAFQVERITSDQHGRPIELSRAVLRGDRYSVRVWLARSRPSLDLHQY